MLRRYRVRTVPLLRRVRSGGVDRVSPRGCECRFLTGRAVPSCDRETTRRLPNRQASRVAQRTPPPAADFFRHDRARQALLRNGRDTTAPVRDLSMRLRAIAPLRFSDRSRPATHRRCSSRDPRWRALRADYDEDETWTPAPISPTPRYSATPPAPPTSAIPSKASRSTNA